MRRVIQKLINQFGESSLIFHCSCNNFIIVEKSPNEYYRYYYEKDEWKPIKEDLKSFIKNTFKSTQDKKQ